MPTLETAGPPAAVAEVPGDAAGAALLPTLDAAAPLCAVAEAPGAAACAVPFAATATLPVALGEPEVRAEDVTLAVAPTRPGVSNDVAFARDEAWPTSTPPGPPWVFVITWEWLIDIVLCGVVMVCVKDRVRTVPPMGEDTVPVAPADVVASVIVAVAARAPRAEVERRRMAAQTPRAPVRAVRRKSVVGCMKTSLAGALESLLGTISE